MQVLLYVGAIMVLFIFTILLINVMQAEFLRQFHGQRPLAAILVVALFAETIFLLLGDFRGNFPLMREPPGRHRRPSGLADLGTAVVDRLSPVV